MILQSISLHPFAGLSNKIYHFENNLNVFCGPNEEGKSTVARAVVFALFTPTNLTPAKRKTTLENFLPHASGDTIGITLEWNWDNKQYKLERHWGGTNKSVLTLPGDSILSNEETITKKILAMLPANEAVVKGILMSSQSELASAITSMKHEAGTELSDKLRNVVLQSGGISGTRLQENITQKIDKYFERWDQTNNGPMGGPNRGILNKWVQGVGLILQAWYELKETENLLQQVEEFEKLDEELSAQIQNSATAMTELETFIAKHKFAYQSVNERIRLEGEIQKAEFLLEQLVKDAVRWPHAEVELKSEKTAINSLQTEINELDIENSNARKRQQAQIDLKKLEEVHKLQNAIAVADKKLRSTKQVKAGDVKLAEDLQKKIELCIAKINAQQLILQLTSAQGGSVLLRRAGGNESVSISKGETKEIKAAGSLRFEWAGLTIEIASGNENIGALETQMSSNEKELKKILHAHSFEELNVLKAAEKDYLEALQLFNTKNSDLKAFLRGDDLLELEQRCEAATNLPQTRDINTLEKNLRLKGDLLSVAKHKSEALTKEIEELVKRNKSQQHLNQRQIDGQIYLNKHQKELDLMVPLPEEFESSIAFQKQYEELRETYAQMQQQKLHAENARDKLVRPEISFTEARDDCHFMQRKFLQAKKEGTAYKKIKAKLEKIMEEADANAFQPLHDKTIINFNRLTNGKYANMNFSGTGPEGISNTQTTLPIHLLSKGTRDSLALALRLAAAEVFLENSKGFIIMDDPLVDMDTARREAAIVLIKEFAAKQQTIIFTCHEAHKVLLHPN